MQQCTTLLAQADALALDAIDSRAHAIDADAPTTINGLHKPAYNAVVRSAGRYSYTLPLSRWERFMQAIA